MLSSLFIYSARPAAWRLHIKYIFCIDKHNKTESFTYLDVAHTFWKQCVKIAKYHALQGYISVLIYNMCNIKLF